MPAPLRGNRGGFLFGLPHLGVVLAWQLIPVADRHMLAFPIAVIVA
jgi:hypothetical protein